jgi:tetratricopeptide (TPR) repeat protein
MTTLPMPDRLETLLQFYQEDPHDAFTCFALAQEYRQRGDTEAARTHFEHLVTLHPDYVGTYYHLGKLYQTLHRTPEAIATYQQGIAVAQAQRDFHARAELQAALAATQDDEEED